MNRPSFCLITIACSVVRFLPAGAATISVTTTDDTGPGSFREAIQESNSSAGVFDTIAFDIPPSDPGHLYYRDDGVAGQVTPASAAATASADDSAIADIDPDWPHSWNSIRPQSVFTEITDPVMIDGYTQPGAILNTNEVGAGLNSILRIEIDCSESVGAGPFEFNNVAFWLIAGDNTIRGLALNRLDGTYFFMDTTDNNRFEGIYLGVDISGTIAPGPQSVGIDIRTSAGNRVGGTTSLARNLIANTLLFTRGGVGGNLVKGNLIGTDRSGMRPLQVPLTGVQILDSPFNVIGGEEAGAGNLISGNQVGVSVAGIQFATGNVIRGNWIGTGVDGLTDVGNLGEGVRIASTDGTVIEMNTIAYNSTGITLRTDEVGHGLGNLITQNSIFSNDAAGIDLGAVDANDIPPLSDPPDQDTGPNNLQNYPVLTSVTDDGAGTFVEGILQSTPNSDFRIEFFANTTRDEDIGFPFNPGEFGEGETYLGSREVSTDANGMAIFNAVVDRTPADQPFITSTATDITDTGEGPLNNTSAFGFVEPVGGCHTTVTTTDQNGIGSLREAFFCSNIMEGRQTIDFNIPADDPRHFYYRDDGVAGQVSRTDVATTAEADDANIADIDPDWPHSWFSIRPDKSLPRFEEAFEIDGYTQPGSLKNTLPALSGLDSVLRIEFDGSNLEGDGFELLTGPEFSLIQGLAINRCGGNGIAFNSFGGSRIMGNYIGTDISGAIALGNGKDGVFFDSERYNQIGGASPELRNLISGNRSNEIEIFSAGSDRVMGNLIGTDRSASEILRDSTEETLRMSGIFFASIGGINEGEGNVIAFDSLIGFALLPTFGGSFKQSTNPIDQLGDCRDELFSVNEDRLRFFASASPEDFVTLEHSTSEFFSCILFGGFVGEARASPILGNRYLSLGTETGIDLGGDGPNPNDPGDIDEGANSTQNYPELTTATSSGGTTSISGTLNTNQQVECRIEFFAAPTSGRAGGDYLGFLNVTTDTNGDAQIDFVSPTSVPGGYYITSTATLLIDLDEDPGNPSLPVETSEFSAPIQVDGDAGPCPTPFPDFNNDDFADAEDLIELFKSVAQGDGVRDLTEDGQTDSNDLFKFSLSWQTMDCSEVP